MPTSAVALHDSGSSGGIMDELSARDIFQQAEFGSFLTAAVDLVERQIAGEEQPTLKRLFQQATGHSAAAVGEAGVAGISAVVTMLDVAAGGDAGTTALARQAAALRGCPVTDIAWSTYAPGTLVAAYAASKATPAGSALGVGATPGRAAGSGSSEAADAPAALLWSVQQPGSPVGALALGRAGSSAAFCPGDLTCVRFHPHAPHLVVGGTSQGQLLLWDVRSGRGEPVAASAFCEAGHVGAVTALLFTGTAASSTIHSFSAEGRVCQWAGTGLGEPTASAQLTARFAQDGKEAQRDVVCSGACFSSADPSRIFLGGQEGGLYIAQFTGNTCTTQMRLPAHYAFLSALAAHPARDVPLLLTASYDGTVKLWNTEVRGRDG
jgi:hypothetical protein